MNQRGYVGLLLLVIGAAFVLFVYLEYSQLDKGATDQGQGNTLDERNAAKAVQDMVDRRNATFQKEMQ